MSKNKKEEKIKIKDKVNAALPNGIFELILENDIEIIGYLSSKIRTNYIRFRFKALEEFE